MQVSVSATHAAIQLINIRGGETKKVQAYIVWKHCRLHTSCEVKQCQSLHELYSASQTYYHDYRITPRTDLSFFRAIAVNAAAGIESTYTIAMIAPNTMNLMCVDVYACVISKQHR